MEESGDDAHAPASVQASGSGKKAPDPKRNLRNTMPKSKVTKSVPTSGDKGAGKSDPKYLELGGWLRSLDGGKGQLLKYLPAFEREFTNLDQLLKAGTAAAEEVGKTALQCVAPEIFEAVGMQLLGHRLLVAKGLVALSQERERQPKNRG